MEAVKELKKRDVKFYDIDKELLKKELADRGETMASAARTIGYADGYFSSMLSEAKREKATNKGIGVPERAIMLLYERFNIRAEDILRKEPVIELVPEVEEGEQELPSNEAFQMNWEQLYNTIYAATYAAMRKALNEK